MTSRRKRRLLLLLIVMLGAGAASALILYALRQNINLFYKPAEIFAQVQLPRQRIRVGGMVRKGSVRQLEGLTVNFAMTDYKQDLQVLYTGVLPDLFKEGQGVVAAGKLNDQKIFIADQILAKHDENYMP